MFSKINVTKKFKMTCLKGIIKKFNNILRKQMNKILKLEVRR